MYDKVRTKALELYLDQFVEQRAQWGVTPDSHRYSPFSYGEYILACHISNYFKSVWFHEGTMNLETFLNYLNDLDDQKLDWYAGCEDIHLLEVVVMDCQEFMIEKMSDMTLIVNDRFYREEFKWEKS